MLVFRFVGVDHFKQDGPVFQFRGKFGLHGFPGEFLDFHTRRTALGGVKIIDDGHRPGSDQFFALRQRSTFASLNKLKRHDQQK